MKLGNFKIIIFVFILFLISTLSVFSADKIESVPLINLEDLSPTFEEDKDELEKLEEQDTNLNKNEDIFEEPKTQKNEKVYINLKVLDKITAKTTAIRLSVGENKLFGSLRIKALKCQLSENSEYTDMVAYLQVKDLLSNDNNQVFLFNGWTFASSSTLQSIDHSIYDLWITNCENV